MIYTGGTIGMKQDPQDMTLKPFDFHQILDEVELKKFALRIDSYTFDPLIDSSDVEPSFWQSLASLIQERYDEYDGFVVCTEPTRCGVLGVGPELHVGESGQARRVHPGSQNSVKLKL